MRFIFYRIYFLGPTIFIFLLANTLRADEMVSTKDLHSNSIKVDSTLNIGSYMVDSETNNAQVFGIDYNAYFSGKLYSKVDWFVDLAAEFETGSVKTSLAFSRYALDNSLSLKDAYVTYDLDFLKIYGGILDISKFSSANFITDSPFISLKEDINLGKYFTISLLQALPTGKDVGISSQDVAKSSATLLAEKVSADFDIINGYVQHFSFDSLGMSTAYDSIFLGNSVNLMGADNSTFIYPYYGWNAGLALNVGNFKLGYDFVINNGAPSDNTAYLVHLTTNYRDYALNLGYFNNGSDPLPGTYSSFAEGSLNREGMLVRLSFKRPDIFWNLAFYNNKVKSINPYQSDEQIIAFNIGRNYEL